MLDVAQLLVAIATLITALGGFVIALVKIKEVHDTTNSKMDAFIAEVRKASFAEGEKSEKDRTK
jgi:uncharacterized membrane protein